MLNDPSPLAYRGDIDGLRAFAVALVVGFHAFPDQMPAGFIGVDIFFVISGFLITSIVASDLNSNSFGLTTFYLRRARRLLPALFVVLLASIIAGWFVLFPVDYGRLGRDVAAGSAFIANLFFFQDAGYFDTASELKPLLHLWSLGVEEQFYIVWPVLLIIVWRWRPGPLRACYTVLALSFLCSLILSSTAPHAAFYLPVARFWELMAGAVLAIVADNARRDHASPRIEPTICHVVSNSPAARESAAWLGVSLIVVALFTVTPSAGYPGWWALLPTVGTALLIYSGGTTWVGRTLSLRAVVYIGLISYPLYLWHWPILVFLRTIRFKEPTTIMRIVAIAAALLLAHWTYRFVERPIRFGRSSRLKPILAAISVASIGLIGLALYFQNGLPSRFDASVQHLVHDYKLEARQDRNGSCLVDHFSRPRQEHSTEISTVILWGDSHAEHLISGLCELASNRPLEVLHFVSGGCPPVLKFKSGKVPDCESRNELALAAISRLTPQLVILAANWDMYDGRSEWGRVDFRAFRATADLIGRVSIRQMVVGQIPVWDSPPAKILAGLHRVSGLSRLLNGPTVVPTKTMSYLKQSSLAANRVVESVAKSAAVRFASPPAELCDSEGCSLVVPNTFYPITFDDNHLTKMGSVFMGRYLERVWRDDQP